MIKSLLRMTMLPIALACTFGYGCVALAAPANEDHLQNAYAAFVRARQEIAMVPADKSGLRNKAATLADGGIGTVRRLMAKAKTGAPETKHATAAPHPAKH